MMDYEWQRIPPRESGWWWLRWAGIQMAEVVVGEVGGIEAGEVRLHGEKRWRDLIYFKDCLWAGPIELPIERRKIRRTP